MKRFPTLMLAVLLVAACRPDTQQHEASAEDPGFAAYLEVTGMKPADAAQRAHVLQTYTEKRALASAILDRNAVDRRLIDAEVDNYRTELVLKRHFDAVLEQELSEAKLREYYEDHAEQFGRVWLRYATFASVDTSEASAQALQQAAQSGTPPTSLAKQHALAVADDGLETHYLDELAPELQTLFRDRKTGDVIGPLVSDGIVTVYRIEEGPALEGASFDEVRQQIAFVLRNEIRQREIQRLLSGSGINE